MASPNRDFLGIGWKFPLQVTPAGRIAQAKYEQRIEESIFLILSTARASGGCCRDFGCGIHDLVFAPNNTATLSQVVQSVRNALTAYEPRIDCSTSTPKAPRSDNLLLIRIDYRIRANNAMGNLVYPFYIRRPPDMPLEDHLPQIDDRRFDDIVAEVRTRIARYAPEWRPGKSAWTDLNDNDPGITLAQVFAWLAEMLLYRMNKVPQLNYINSCS